MGGILAKYAAEGVHTTLITATRGERGWNGQQDAYPGPESLGQIREAELTAAASILGIQEVAFLDYLDGELDQADPQEAIAKIVTQLRRIRPQVVVTFDPYGAYGHPDHIAISQFALAAVIAAADPNYDLSPEWPPHRVSKFYYGASTKYGMAAYEAAFGDLVMEIDGRQRRSMTWPDWAITTRIETVDYWQQVWQAVSCHRSQLPSYGALSQLPPAQHEALWGVQHFYRAFSLVNGGRQLETDLFEGLRPGSKQNKS
jgi:LmbE family N-acetylglucosaminyl deacetylase